MIRNKIVEEDNNSYLLVQTTISRSCKLQSVKVVEKLLVLGTYHVCSCLTSTTDATDSNRTAILCLPISILNLFKSVLEKN